MHEGAVPGTKHLRMNCIIHWSMYGKRLEDVCGTQPVLAGAVQTSENLSPAAPASTERIVPGPVSTDAFCEDGAQVRESARKRFAGIKNKRGPEDESVASTIKTPQSSVASTVHETIDSEDVPERMPDRMSEEMPERMLERMSQYAPERMSERRPTDVPERVSERMSEEMPQRMSKRMSDRMSECWHITTVFVSMSYKTRQGLVAITSSAGQRQDGIS